MVRIAVLAFIFLTTTNCAFTKRFDNDPGVGEENRFVGGRGLVTSEGPTGLFVNPTSGTYPKGTATFQLCAAIFDNGAAGTFAGIKSIASYAATDWLEIGATSLDIQNDNMSAAIGPQVRARLLKDKEDSLQPEVAIGGYSNEGRTPMQKRVVFAAASKALPVPKDGEGFLKSARFHAGIRQAWREVDTPNDTVGYGGIEIELPQHIFFAAEISTDDNGYPHTPFGFGLQFRHPDGWGLTLAGMQPGFSSDIGLFVGIGLGLSW